MKRFSIAALLAVISLSASSFAADEAYPIKIHRAHKVGMIFDTHVTGSMENSQVVTEDGKEVDNKSMTSTIDLTGRQKISDVNEKGKDKIVVIKIDKCVDAAGKELIAPGSELTVEFSSDDVKFSLDKGTLDEKAEMALGVIFTPSRDTKPDDDAFFGTKDPKKPAESWPVNIKELLGDLGIKMDEKNASGTMTLKSVEKVQGKECLRLGGAISLKNIPNDRIPKTVTIKQADMNITIEGLLPRDESLPEFESTQEMNVKQVLVDEESKQQVTVIVKGKKHEVNTMVK